MNLRAIERMGWIASSEIVPEPFVPVPCVTSQMDPGVVVDWVSLVDRQLMGFESDPCKDER